MPDTPDAPDALATELRLACLRLSRRIRYESTLDIAPHLYSVLIHLDGGPLTPRDLAGIERVSAPSMTRTLNALEGLGLVARDPHPSDGRQLLVRMTPDGESLVARTRASRDSWMARRVDALSPHERELVAAALPVLTRLAGE